MNRRDRMALRALTRSLTRRMLREGMVLRSLLWPPVLAAGTLLTTLVVAAALAAPPQLGVTASVEPRLIAALSDAFTVFEVPDAEAAVADQRVWAATDGATVWVSGPGPDSDRLEAIVRTHARAPWRPAAAVALPDHGQSRQSGSQIVRILVLLFTLYGVVFGLGMVARDRDNGTLESELSLPVSRWVPGAARWLAATGVLSLFSLLTVALFDALIGVNAPTAMLRNTVAACSASVTIGMAVVGQAGIRRGFAGPFAFGLTGVSALVGLGSGWPALGRWLPLASIFTGSDGWFPMLLGLASGMAASHLFAVRSTGS